MIMLKKKNAFGMLFNWFRYYYLFLFIQPKGLLFIRVKTKFINFNLSNNLTKTIFYEQLFKKKYEY